MKNNETINWLKQSLEDENGQASYKRIGIAIFLFLIAYMVLAKMIITVLWLNTFYALLLSSSVWVGLVTIPQVLQFMGRDKNNNQPAVQDPTKAVEIKGTFTQMDKP
jgi:hypothetical protein